MRQIASMISWVGLDFKTIFDKYHLVGAPNDFQQKFEEVWQQLGTYEQDIKQLAAVEKENQDKIRRAIYGDRAFGGTAPTLDEQRKDTAPIMDNAARELK